MLQNNLPTNTLTAKIVYVVLAVGLFVPFVGIIALIVAYVYKSDGPYWLYENYRFAIRTFWIGALYLVISYFLTFIFIGFLTLFLTYIWYIIRCAKGFKAVSHEKAPDNVNTWLF